jgi:hypothetical protein
MLVPCFPCGAITFVSGSCPSGRVLLESRRPPLGLKTSVYLSIPRNNSAASQF